MECRDYSYNNLMALIERCVVKTAYREIANCGKLVVIATNIETRFEKFIKDLQREKNDIELIIVAQPTMENILRDSYGGKYQIVGWKGRYTLDVLDKINKEGGLNHVNGFVFFSEQAVNLRDANFIDIAENLQTSNGVRVFSNIIGDEVYEYRNIDVYNRAMRIYQDVNILIDLSMQNGIDKGDSR